MSVKKREKYLRTRAAITPWHLEGCTGTNFSAAIVIPALAEFESLPRTLESLLLNPAELLAGMLVVVVVNNRVSASIAEKSENHKTLDWLSSNPCPGLNLAWVDATHSGLELPEKDGVGLARKIGFDLALSRLDWAIDPVLISLDADCLTDRNYLSAILTHFHTDSALGAYLPFRHQRAAMASHEQAIRRYELYLRSTLFGLQWAGSRYAFTGIGSALACRAAAYVAAGGMKRRLAGEDFYFLQQLVKTGKVSSLSGTLVRPSPRLSMRVPFGTGRTVQAGVCEGGDLYRFTSLASFHVLKDWLQLVAQHQDAGAAELLALARTRSPVLADFLLELNFTETWYKLQRNCSPANFLWAWNNWFDGLRTRQLLARLEELQKEIDSVTLVAELLTAADFSTCCDLGDQLRLLESLQGVPMTVKGEVTL